MNDIDDRSGRIAEAAKRHYNAPPATPREEMWTEIEGRLDAGDAGGDTGDGVDTNGRPVSIDAVRKGRPLPWWLGIAAALVVGLGIGRMTLPDGGESGGSTTALAPNERAPVGTAADAPPPAAAGNPVRGYDVATRTHLGQTEILLAGLRADMAGSDRPIDVGPRARTLLTRTRLLLGSPAARDSETRRLLEDVELLLAQVALAAEAGDTSEARILRGHLDEGNLLRRLRSAGDSDGNEQTPRGPRAATL